MIISQNRYPSQANHCSLCLVKRKIPFAISKTFEKAMMYGLEFSVDNGTKVPIKVPNKNIRKMSKRLCKGLKLFTWVSS